MSYFTSINCSILSCFRLRGNLRPRNYNKFSWPLGQEMWWIWEQLCILPSASCAKSYGFLFIISSEFLNCIPSFPMFDCLRPAVRIIFWHRRLWLLTHRAGQLAPLWLHLFDHCLSSFVYVQARKKVRTLQPEWRNVLIRGDLRSTLTTWNAGLCDGHCGMLARPALLANPETPE